MFLGASTGLFRGCVSVVASSSVVAFVDSVAGFFAFFFGYDFIGSKARSQIAYTFALSGFVGFLSWSFAIAPGPYEAEGIRPSWLCRG